MKKTTLLLASLVSCFTVFSQENDAYSVFRLPTESTIAGMQLIQANTGSLLFNTEDNFVYLYNGTNWVNAFNNDWSILGNTGLTSDSFLGHIDDVVMEIRSDNLPLLQFGRRETLGLTQNIPDYTDTTQPLVVINGDGNTSALQFTAESANVYKPMIFTTDSGNFRIKGSSGLNDLFEIGSTGPNNQGALEFVVGDDGFEPMIFKRYDYRNRGFYSELFRVQGSNNIGSAKTRFGININPEPIAIDPEYNDAYYGNAANSTLQVSGSVSTSITTTTADITLTEDEHTIIIGGTHNVTLPTASECEGRMYIIKNPQNSIRAISAYLDLTNTEQTAISANAALWLKSDGTNWHQINNTVTTSATAYEKIVIWAEEDGDLNNNANEWSFGAGSNGASGIALPEDWTLYAVSFNADESDDDDDEVEIAIMDRNTNTQLFTFTASGDENNIIYTEILTTPIAIPAGTAIGFRTINEDGDITDARVAAFLRRLP